MSSLTRGEVRKALKKLRELGIKPPAVGSCVTVKTDVQLCRHGAERYIPGGTGYQLVSWGPHGLFGARRRRRRR